MTFKLRSQSPLRQEDPMSRFKKPSSKIQESIKESNKTVSKSKENKESISISDRLSQDWDRQNPVVKSVIQLADFTGTSSYPDVKKAWSDKKTTLDDFTEPLGAIPLIGKLPKVYKLAKSMSTITRIAQAGSKINKATSKVNKASKLANQEKVGEAIANSPLQKQKLSPKAAKAKAERDLAFAKTDDRRAKKAHSQRMHRKNPGNKGMDYDHEDGRFESVKQNRGNDGNGTKSESGKNYKTK